jgi:hypothetical protein
MPTPASDADIQAKMKSAAAEKIAEIKYNKLSKFDKNALAKKVQLQDNPIVSYEPKFSKTGKPFGTMKKVVTVTKTALVKTGITSYNSYSTQAAAADFLSSGLQINLNGPKPVVPSYQNKANEMLVDRVQKATDNNVDLQNKSIKFGTSVNYRIYCHRCKAEYALREDQVNHADNVCDDIVLFCIKHRHDGGGNSLKVLSTFANVVVAAPEAIPEKVGRVFREDDDE